MKYILTNGFILVTILSLAGQGRDYERVKSTVKIAAIKGHIQYLASDELKGRETGTPEIDSAAGYLAKAFEDYGAKPLPGNPHGYFQKVEFEKTLPATYSSLVIDGSPMDQIALLEGLEMAYYGNAVYLNYGSVSDFENNDVADKIVVVRAGTALRQDFRSAYFEGRNKRQLAQQMGAAGLVELIDLDDTSWEFMANFTSSEKIALRQNQPHQAFAHIWGRNQETELFKALEEGEVELELNISGIKNSGFFSNNVVAFIEGSDPLLKKEYVVYSAHYDHIGIARGTNQSDSIYNGARDNAVGVVTVLSAAQSMGKYPTKRSALFILFTAEEKGLLGSQYFVANPLVPLNQIVFCFNSDNGGYNDTSLATIIGLNRTTAAEHIKDAARKFGLNAQDDPEPEQGLFDRSDNVHFAAAGIPAPTYSLGFTAFDEDISKYYHQVSDHAESLDYDYLLKFFRSYVLACHYIADDPRKPFWVEGDKYYPAGKALYGN